MPISIETIAECIRPQFVWDIKLVNHWYLRNSDRTFRFFYKDMGLVTFLNLSIHYDCNIYKLQEFIQIDSFEFATLQADLAKIVYGFEQDDFSIWKRKQLLVKTGLTKNLIYHKYSTKI